MLIAVNMDRKTCGTFSSFRWLSPDIYHIIINILRNPNEVDVHWGDLGDAISDVFAELFRTKFLRRAKIIAFFSDVCYFEI